MSLQAAGFRFMAAKNDKRTGWAHPAEIAYFKAKFEGLTDCTDMSIAEFDKHMGIEIKPAAAAI